MTVCFSPPDEWWVLHCYCSHTGWETVISSSAWSLYVFSLTSLSRTGCCFPTLLVMNADTCWSCYFSYVVSHVCCYALGILLDCLELFFPPFFCLCDPSSASALSNCMLWARGCWLVIDCHICLVKFSFVHTGSLASPLFLGLCKVAIVFIMCCGLLDVGWLLIATPIG